MLLSLIKIEVWHRWHLCRCLFSMCIFCLSITPVFASASQGRKSSAKPAEVKGQNQQEQTTPAAAQAETLYEAGQRSHQEKDYQQAAKFYQQALSLDGTLWQARLQLSQIYVSLGQYVQARESIDQVLKELTDLTESEAKNSVLARVYVLSGEIALAEKQAERADNVFQEAIKLQPANSRAYRGLAEAQWLLSKPDEAIINAKKAIALGDEQSATRILLSLALVITKQEDSALSVLQEVLQREPRNQQALQQRANLFLTRKQFTQAIGDLEALYQLSRDKGVLFQLAIAQVNAKQFDGALRTYQQVLEVEPENAEAKTALAALMVETGKANEAIVQLEQLIKAEPNRADLHAQLAALYQSVRPEKALEHYLTAVNLAPQQTSYQLGLASTLVRLRRFQEAVPLLQKLLAGALAVEQVLVARNNLATALFELDDFINAARQFEWLVAQYEQTRDDRRKVIALYFLGICFDKSGELELAANIYQRFLTSASADQQLEIDKVKLRMPSLQRQLREGKGKRKK